MLPGQADSLTQGRGGSGNRQQISRAADAQGRVASQRLIRQDRLRTKCCFQLTREQA
jgi:hypothetical protein